MHTKEQGGRPAACEGGSQSDDGAGQVLMDASVRWCHGAPVMRRPTYRRGIRSSTIPKPSPILCASRSPAELERNYSATFGGKSRAISVENGVPRRVDASRCSPRGALRFQLRVARSLRWPGSVAAGGCRRPRTEVDCLKPDRSKRGRMEMRATASVVRSELESCLTQAFHRARSARHEFLTVEHLLLAILDTPRVREVLAGCGADLDQLGSTSRQHARANHSPGWN